MIKQFIRAIALLFLFAAVPDAAQNYYFSVTNDDTGALLTSFSLPASPRPPKISGITGQYFYFSNVSVNYNGPRTIDYLTFWKVDAVSDPVLTFEDPGYILALYSVDGTSTYTGSEDAPNFKLGSYAVYDGNGQAYTLTIGLPEPQTWLMMILGFGAVGGALRKRHRFKDSATGWTSLAAAT